MIASSYAMAKSNIFHFLQRNVRVRCNRSDVVGIFRLSAEEVVSRRTIEKRREETTTATTTRTGKKSRAILWVTAETAIQWTELKQITVETTSPAIQHSKPRNKTEKKKNHQPQQG